MRDDQFEWDDGKNVANHAKHGVWFERARLAFSDAFAVGECDDRESYGEDRFMIVGMSDGVLLFVAYTERMVEGEGDGGAQERIRIISARRATRHEQDDYYHQNGQTP